MIVGVRWSCGSRLWARSIGPATSCGKNETNVRKRTKLRSVWIVPW